MVYGYSAQLHISFDLRICLSDFNQMQTMLKSWQNVWQHEIEVCVQEMVVGVLFCFGLTLDIQKYERCNWLKRKLWWYIIYCVSSVVSVLLLNFYQISHPSWNLDKSTSTKPIPDFLAYIKCLKCHKIYMMTNLPDVLVWICARPISSHLLDHLHIG